MATRTAFKANMCLAAVHHVQHAGVWTDRTQDIFYLVVFYTHGFIAGIDGFGYGFKVLVFQHIKP